MCSLCGKDFSIFLVFFECWRAKIQDGVTTKIFKALQMSWPIAACLVQPNLKIAQQLLWWHASVHTFLLPNRLATSCNSCWQQASVLACMVQVKIKKEDFYAASQAESNSLWCLKGLIFVVVLTSMKSSNINEMSLEYLRSVGSRVWGFDSTRSSWLPPSRSFARQPTSSEPSSSNWEIVAERPEFQIETSVFAKWTVFSSGSAKGEFNCPKDVEISSCDFLDENENQNMCKSAWMYAL